MIDPDEDIDDKLLRRLAEQQPTPSQRRQQQRSRQTTTTSDDEESETLALPTQPTRGVPATLPARSVGPSAGATGTETAAAARADYSSDDGSEVVTTAAAQPVVRVEPSLPRLSSRASSVLSESATRDDRDALNEVYAMRRASLHVDRQSALHGERVTTPTEATALRPVSALVVTATPTAIGSTQSAIDMLLALEYTSVFQSDSNTAYTQGDEFGSSDTVGFSDGRTYIDRSDPTNSVPPKRLASVDADDIDPRTLEAANYQHSFSPTMGRYDAALPLYAMSDLVRNESAIADDIAQIERLLDTDPTERTAEALQAAAERGALVVDTIDFLSRSRNGVAALFSALSSATITSAEEYESVRRRADRRLIAKQLETPLQQARDTDTPGLGLKTNNALRIGAPRALQDKPASALADAESLVAYESLSTIEDALVERHQNAEQPHMLRVRTSGPYTVVGSVVEYDLQRPAGSLIDALTGGTGAGAAAAEDWEAAAKLLSAREVDGLALNDVPLTWTERLAATAKRAGLNPREIDERDDLEVEDALRRAVGVPLDTDATTSVRRRVRRDAQRKQDQPAADASAAVPKRRRVAATEEDEFAEAQQQQQQQSVASESKAGQARGKQPKKRKAPATAESPSDAPRTERDPYEEDPGDVEPKAGEDVASDSEDADLQDRDLREEHYEKGEGRGGKRNIDLTLPGYIESESYPYPMIGVPLGWSCVDRLRALETAFRTSERPDDVWRDASAWTTIVELAVYCKLVPSMRTPSWFPAEARAKLVYTLALVSRRVTNEIAFHTDSLDDFNRQSRTRRLRLRDEIKRLRGDQETIAQRLATAKRRVDRSDDDSAVQTIEAEQQQNAARLAAASAELATEEESTLVTQAAVPAVIALHVAPESQLRYIGELRGDAPSTHLSEAERVSLGLAYAASGRRPAIGKSLFETSVLPASSLQRNDALYYPQDISYRARLVDLTRQDATNGLSMLLRFASLTGQVAQVQAVEASLTDADAGVYLDRLVERLEQTPLLYTQTRTSLAEAVYPELARRGTLNPLKHVYLAPPRIASVESFGAAAGMMDWIYTKSGTFSTKNLVELEKAERTNIDKRTRESLEARGSERLVASAAQRYANEYSAPSRYKIDDVPPVPADFKLDDGTTPKPIGVYLTVDRDVVVDREKTSALLTSRDMLGGGRVAAASVAVVPRGAARSHAAIAKARAEATRAFVDDAQRRLAAAGNNNDDDEEVDGLVDEIEQAKMALDDMSDAMTEDEQSVSETTTMRTDVAPFCFFVFPRTMNAICAAVAAAPTTEQRVASICRTFTEVYASDAAYRERLGDAEAVFNAYRAYLVTLVAGLARETAANGSVVIDIAAGRTSRAAFVAAVVSALTAPLPRMPVLLEETSRPDAVATQPFSCLAALELAKSKDRLAIRDALMDVWYRLSSDYRWARLGYMQQPFNSSFTFGLPLAAAHAAGYDSFQTMHLALRHALRRLRHNKNDVGADEADSSDDEKQKSEFQVDDERLSGALQLRTLLNAIEVEVARAQTGQVLWFDLFGVGADALAFAANVRSALGALYAAISSGRRVATIALLASRRGASREKPMALDPRAQSIVDAYWVDFGAATTAREEQEALHVALQDLYGGDGDASFFATVDSAFYDVAAERGKRIAAAQAFAEEADDRRRATDELEARKNRAASAAANERREKTIGDTRGIAAIVGTLVAAETSQQQLEELIAELDNPRQPDEEPTPTTTGAETEASRENARLRAERKRRAALSDAERKKERAAAVAALSASTKDVLAAQKRIRAAYVRENAPNIESDMRRNRIQSLLADVKELRAAIRDKTAARIAENPQASLTAAMAELRATIYDDERDVVATQLAGEIDSAQKELASLEKTIAAAPLSDARGRVKRDAKRRDLVGKIKDLGTTRTYIYQLADIRLQAEIDRKSGAAIEREQAAEKAVRDAAEEQRKKVDAQLSKLANATLATVEDERHDIPASRAKAVRLDEEGEPAYAGYYDAPLANHKSITAEGVRLAHEIVHAANRTAEVRETLKAFVPTEARIDTYVTEALEVIDSITKARVAETEGRLRLLPRADDETRQILRRHVSRVVDDAIADRLRRRYRAASSLKDPTVADLSEDDFVTQGTVAANRAFGRLQTTISVGGSMLRKVDFAALRLIEREYTAFVKSRDSARLLGALDSVSVAGRTRKLDVPRVIELLLLPAAIERAKLQLQQAREADNDAAATTPWALANRQDVPQSLRIAEIVERFALTGRLPLQSQAAARIVSPYSQYDEIRRLNVTEAKARKEERAVVRALKEARRALEVAETEAEPAEGLEVTPEDALAVKRARNRVADLEGDLAALKKQISSNPFSAKSSLAALGRLRYFDDRVAALRAIGIVQQRASFGNGLHMSQPFGCDLTASALCAQLLSLYASVHTTVAVPLSSVQSAWTFTQTSDDGALMTQQVAALPRARDRLWCHLAMLFGDRGSTSALLPVQGKLTFPVLEHMRAVDIRLLALAVLGYDYASRVDPHADDDDAADAVAIDDKFAYTRGHGAKFALAQAFYEQYVESRFSPLPSAASLDGRRPEQISVVWTIVATPELELKPIKQVYGRGDPRPTSVEGANTLVAQYDEAQLTAAVRTQIVSSWTSADTRTLVDLRYATVASRDATQPSSIAERIRSFVDVKGEAYKLVVNAVVKAAVAASPQRAAYGGDIIDHAWLLIPRCVVLGALVRIALTADDVAVFAGRRTIREAARERTMDALERILLLCDDSGHLMHNDESAAAPAERSVGADIMALDNAEIAPAPTDDAVALASVPPLLAATVPVPAIIGVDEWTKRVERGIQTLLAAPYYGELRGTTRVVPYTSDRPFAPVPLAVTPLLYVQTVVFGDGRLLETWQSIRVVLRAVERAFGAADPLVALAAAGLDERQLVLATLVARSEQKRREAWQFGVDGVLVARVDATDANKPIAPRHLFDSASRASPYQDWHVLLLAAASREPSALDAMRSFVARHRAEPQTGALAFAARLVSAQQPRVTALAIEQAVPIYETLLYYFDKDGSATSLPYATSQRYPLWALLAAPLYQRAVVCIETTSQIDTKSGIPLCVIAPPALASATRSPRAYLPYAAFSAADAKAEAQRLRLNDAERTVVVHEHVFAQLDASAPDQEPKMRVASRLTTLARFTPLDTTAAEPYSVDDALTAAYERGRAFLIGTAIPTASSK